MKMYKPGDVLNITGKMLSHKFNLSSFCWSEGIDEPAIEFTFTISQPLREYKIKIPLEKIKFRDTSSIEKFHLYLVRRIKLLVVK